MHVLTNESVETVCIKCLILFCEKKKERKISLVTNLSSAELAQRMVKVKKKKKKKKRNEFTPHVKGI